MHAFPILVELVRRGQPTREVSSLGRAPASIARPAPRIRLQVFWCLRRNLRDLRGGRILPWHLARCVARARHSQQEVCFRAIISGACSPTFGLRRAPATLLTPLLARLLLLLLLQY